MKLVVDANVFISALISRKDTHMMITYGAFEMFSPEYMLEEIEEHLGEIKEKSKLEMGEFGASMEVLKRRIKFVKAEMYAVFRKHAREISPDVDDVEYFALVIYLGEDAALWSNDKNLKEQQSVRVYSTAELVKMSGLEPNLPK